MYSSRSSDAYGGIYSLSNFNQNDNFRPNFFNQHQQNQFFNSNQSFEYHFNGFNQFQQGVYNNLSQESMNSSYADYEAFKRVEREYYHQQNHVEPTPEPIVTLEITTTIDTEIPIQDGTNKDDDDDARSYNECEMCKTIFIDQACYDEHKKMGNCSPVKPRKKNHQCIACKKSFDKVHNYRIHLMNYERCRDLTNRLETDASGSEDDDRATSTSTSAV